MKTSWDDVLARFFRYDRTPPPYGLEYSTQELKDRVRMKRLLRRGGIRVDPYIKTSGIRKAFKQMRKAQTNAGKLAVLKLARG